MRVCSIADLHGILDFSVEKCDILCICGDILPLKIQRNDNKSFVWLETTFLNWVNQQPCDRVILIGGNHDFAIYHDPNRIRSIFKDTKVVYLLDEEYVYSVNDKLNIKFYGSPWCHKFYNWAYMDYDDDKLREIFLKMPEDVDVLVTHDCPKGACDVILQDVWWANGEHIGSIGLCEAVIERKPKMMFTGHLHSTNKLGELLGNTMVYNTSIIDENYKLSYKPHYFDINNDKEVIFVNKDDFN